MLTFGYFGSFSTCALISSSSPPSSASCGCVYFFYPHREHQQKNAKIRRLLCLAYWRTFFVSTEDTHTHNKTKRKSALICLLRMCELFLSARTTNTKKQVKIPSASVYSACVYFFVFCLSAQNARTLKNQK